SRMVNVLLFSSRMMSIVRSPSSPLNSPREASTFNLLVASTALETSSRRKISWSAYRNFLMMGKMLSVCTDILPCSIVQLFLWLSVKARATRISLPKCQYLLPFVPFSNAPLINFYQLFVSRDEFGTDYASIYVFR